MKLLDAINASGGLKEGSYTPDIELIRSIQTGKIRNYAMNSGTKAMSEIKLEALQASDIINIKKIAKPQAVASINGEVFHPGDFPIIKNETLAGLIQRAGGLTDKAQVGAAIFLRKSLRDSELEKYRQAQTELKRKILIASQSSNIGEETLDPELFTAFDALLTDQTSEANIVGRLIINLENIIQGEEKDIVLEDGDTLIIPQQTQTIAVIGEVFAPNAHIYRENSRVDDYINQSGGVTEFADIDNRYIIKSDGSIIPPSDIVSGSFFRSTSTLQPGDTIVIPLQIVKFSGLEATTEISQIIYQLAVAAAAVSSFSN